LGSSKAPLGKPCIAFYKYDGSNLRWEWSPKQGWHKFGTRHELFDATNPIFGQAIPIFLNTMADEIVERVKNIDKKIHRITAFTEFFGPSSFAGKHEPNEPKELKLFDVYLFRQGMMLPKEFVKTFGNLPYSAKVVYEGNLNKQFIDDVRNGKYPVVEGVVAKGNDFSIKIKTNSYFQKLNEVYGTNYRLYWE
jgi:hypothetical protein